MGKIRVKTLGSEEAEDKQKKESKKRKESKRLVKGAKGGERIVAVGPSEEELARLENEKPATTETQKEIETQKQKLSASDKFSASVVASKTSKAKPKKARSKSYQAIAKMVDKTKKYSLSEALDLISKLNRAKFDETVELHLNTLEKGISGNVALPHGTGKKIKVAIADDDLIAKVEKGKIDFDVLLAEPSMMPKLARVAKFLGPRGLMPNPKSGTITNNPKELAKKYEGGQINFKTETKAPIIHLTVGKVSFGQKKLMENINTILSSVQANKIKNITLKSTMSPGIKVQLVKLG